MQKTLLEKSPEVAPILVNLYDRHKLYSLAKDKDVQARAELADIMVDLLKIELSERETELLTDVIIGLVRQAEKDLKKALAERLSVMDNVPLRMVLHLANEEIDVAQSILRFSKVLQDMDLVYIIKSKGPEHWRAIAERVKMGPQVMNALAETRDLGTAITMASNDNLILSDQAITIFVEMSKESDELARPLLMRDELPGIVGRVLYEFVGEEIKKVIHEKFPIEVDMVEATIDDLVDELTVVEPNNDKLQPSLDSIEIAQGMARHGGVRIDVMMTSLKRGQLGSFVAMFSEFAQLPIATVQEILRQDTGQGLAVACRALEVPKGDFMSIFLLCKKLRFGEGVVVRNEELTRASAYYDKLTREMALEILNQSKN